jgi:hypothetical protein
MKKTIELNGEATIKPVKQKKLTKTEMCVQFLRAFGIQINQKTDDDINPYLGFEVFGSKKTWLIGERTIEESKIKAAAEGLKEKLDKGLAQLMQLDKGYTVEYNRNGGFYCIDVKYNGRNYNNQDYESEVRRITKTQTIDDKISDFKRSSKNINSWFELKDIPKEDQLKLMKKLDKMIEKAKQ